MEQNSILKDNERKANIIAAKVMRITFVLFTLVYILDITGVFTVDKAFMTLAFVLGSIFLLIPTVVVNLMKKEECSWVKYVNVICAVLFVFFLTFTLSFHVVVLYVYAIAIASLYFSKRLSIITTVATVLSTSAGQIMAYVFNTLVDKNFGSMSKVIIFSVLPRGIVLIAVAAIFIMLSRRTADLLGSLMGAEQQEAMLNHMTKMKEKSLVVSEELLSVVKTLASTSENASLANQKIAEETEAVMRGSSENKEHIKVVSERMEDISNKLVNLNKMSGDISVLSEKVKEVTQDNQECMNKATDSMNKINQSSDECKTIIHNLGEQSKEIIDIINVITEISTQTNILALNASIEAARAGEHGRGFSVVAEEIQKLAEQTNGAVENIGKIIREVVVNTEKAVSAMEDSSKLTKEGMTVIKRAESSANIITESNNEMSRKIFGMEEISKKVMENSKDVAENVGLVSQNVAANFNSIEHVAASTQENTAGAEELVRMVDKIEELSQQLNEVVH